MQTQRVPINSDFFYSDHGHEADECHVLKKDIERLIVRDYLQQFMKKKT